MKPLEQYTKAIPFIISMLFIVVFIFAGSSKLIDYYQFQQQLEQSDILKGYAGTLSWIVPTIEIVISLFLLIPRFRIFALYACLGLMIMFTIYITLMLHFSETIPCSCGGVISTLGWRGHLYLNLCLALLAFIGIFTSIGLQKRLSNKNTT